MSRGRGAGSPVTTGIRAVSVPVDDRDTALAFYRDVLGFAVLRDVPTPNGRWIELQPGGGEVVITLEDAGAGTHRGSVLVRFTTGDVAAAHAELTARGVEVDEVLRWPGVPPMFAFRDHDGNTFSITET